MGRDGYNLIDIEQIIYDLFYKLKNYFIYAAYFDLLKNFLTVEINFLKEENNFKYIFEHLNKLNEIQESNLNKIIILNNDSFHDFFSTILINMNKDIYKKYPNALIKFCKDVIYNNFELSKVFDKMIDNIKTSFLNLNTIKNEKNINDYLMIIQIICNYVILME